MQQEQLDYRPPPPRESAPPLWDALAGLSLVLPFVAVPAFVVGTALLQDSLINGDGRSWHRAAVRMAVPTGFATAATMLGALRLCVQPRWRRPAAIVVAVDGPASRRYFVLNSTFRWRVALAARLSSVMQQEQLDYRPPPPRESAPPLWDALAGLSLVLPFVAVPAFVVGTALLQDSLINGDGRSWHRAAVRMAVPTGFATAATMLGALRLCVQPRWRRPAAIVGLLISSLALLFIVYATLSA